MLAAVTVAFVLGLLLGAYLPYLPVTILLLLLLIALGVTMLECRGSLPHRRGLILYGGLLLGAVYWTLHAWIGPGPAPLRPSGEKPVRIVGTVVEPVRHAPGRMGLTLSALELGDGPVRERAEGRVRVTWREPDRVFFQGDRVELVARLRQPWGTMNPGGFDYGEYLVRRGIQGVAAVSGSGRVLLVAAPEPWSWRAAWHRLDEWRHRVRHAAVATLSGPALALFLGMVIGEPGFLTPAVRDAFMATGTVHILSISGSHLGCIAFLSFLVIQGGCRRLPPRWLLALSRRVTPSRLAAGATVVPVTFYTLLAGAEIATIRSLIMILIFLLAVWLGREQQLGAALACAAILILVHDPQALFDISFQLSYGSVLAIAMLVQWRRGQREEQSFPAAWTWARLRLWIGEYGWVTGGVTLATLPLVAYHFNQIAWLGPVGNVIVVPLAGMVLVPLGLLSTLWLLVTGGTSVPAGSIMQGLFAGMFRAVQWLAEVPGAEWHVASPAVVGMITFYVLLYVTARPLSPGGIRSGCALAMTLLLAWWAWSPRSGNGDTLRVTFLDVGQGDASVVELPDGQTVLIDAGAAYDTLDLGRAVVAPFLWDRGIKRLDHVIATHPQLDHVGGLPWVLRSFPVGHYWGNGVGREEPVFLRLQEALRARGLIEQEAMEGREILSEGPCRLRSLNPPLRGSPEVNPGSHGASGTTLNDLSVVARLDCGPHSFLFTGDVEADALVRMARSGLATPVRVVKVPHHGAKGSVDVEWIKGLHAEVAVITVGRHNAYGHPAPVTVAAYRGERVRLLRTDRDGAVSMTGSLSSGTLRIDTAREGRAQPVRIGSAVLQAEGRNLGRLLRRWAGQTV